jgi:uncharacterized protein (TIGR02996 family)
MNTDVAFLAAIASNPSDGLARLVYADWLDENGRAGGEFVRTEHELGNLSPDQPRWHELFRLHQKAGRELPPEWSAAVRRHPTDHWLTLAARGAWQRLENWCRQHHPRLLETLNPGATVGDIATFEEMIGQPLPADVRESFAIHNGETERGGGFVMGLHLHPAQLVIESWESWRDFEGYNEEFRDGMKSWPAGAIQLDYANPGWLPLTRDAGGNHMGVDLAPGPAGKVGQVILFGRDEDRKCVLASGWAEFLADFAMFLESGAVVHMKLGEVVPIDPNPDVWGDICCNALGGRHPHDILRKWRQEGRWPVRAAT